MEIEEGDKVRVLPKKERPEIPCPDCTDESEGLITDNNIDSDNPDELLDEPRESEDYSEPRPEDDPFGFLMEKIPFLCRGMDQNLAMEYISDYIDDLEKELSDCREEWEEYALNWKMAQQERDNLQKRIEEAKDYIIKKQKEWMGDNILGTIENILSDIGEGNGDTNGQN